MREKYVDTLAKLYEYATTVYSKNQYTQWYDTKEVAILSQSMPNWSVAFFATVSFGRISIPILPEITGPRMFQSPDGLLLILSVRSHCTQESCLGNPCEVFM